MKKIKQFVIVAASMSAGKSSLINALLGRELLPTGNEATTAKVTRISVGVKTKSNAKAYSISGAVVASSNSLCPKQLGEWNRSDEIAAFDVNIPTSGSKLHSILAGYTLIDTPGANNSRDARHKEQFINAIKIYPRSPVLYVLNATQLGTTDDAEIIRSIREINPKQSIIFALNKVDTLDEEKGETAKRYVSLARKYLGELGYTKATIIPLMAQSALIAKKLLNQSVLTRNERNILKTEMARFRENPFHLNSAAVAPQVVKKNVRKRLARISKGKILEMSNEELHAFVDYTGLSTVNALIMNES